MTLDSISSEPILIHYLTQIGFPLFHETTCMVALSRFKLQSSAVLVHPSANFFDHVIDHEVPGPKDMLSASVKSFFLSLWDYTKEVDSFRNIVLLPPCMDVVIMVDTSLLPTDLVLVVLAVSTNMKSVMEDAYGFNAYEHYCSTARTLSFLWCCQRNLLKRPCLGFTAAFATTSWWYSIHANYLLLGSPSRPDLTANIDISDDVLTSLSSNMFNGTHSFEFQHLKS